MDAGTFRKRIATVLGSFHGKGFSREVASRAADARDERKDR
jgi:hypothetical protein